MLEKKCTFLNYHFYHFKHKKYFEIWVNEQASHILSDYKFPLIYNYRFVSKFKKKMYRIRWKNTNFWQTWLVYFLNFRYFCECIFMDIFLSQMCSFHKLPHSMSKIHPLWCKYRAWTLTLPEHRSPCLRGQPRQNPGHMWVYQPLVCLYYSRHPPSS